MISKIYIVMLMLVSGCPVIEVRIADSRPVKGEDQVDYKKKYEELKDSCDWFWGNGRYRNEPPTTSKKPHESYDEWYRRVGPIIPAGD